MSAEIVDKFDAFGYEFVRANRRTTYWDHNKQAIAEVDIQLENGNFVLAIEVKTQLTTEDIKDHVQRMEILRSYAAERQDSRIYIGAVTGGIIDDFARGYALKNGFYVIEPSGDTINIEAPPQLRTWKPVPDAARP
jgi:hypothetical protein